MDVLERLASLEARTISAPDDIDPAELEALCAALRARPDVLRSPRHAAEVAARLCCLAEWAQARSEAMGQELRALGEGRRAMRGYGTLRAAHTAQRLFERA